MTEGQSFECSNEYRTRFYDDAIKLANEKVDFCSFIGFFKMTNISQFNEQAQDARKSVKDSGTDLCRFIDPYDVLDSSGPRRPLLIFSFDESHILTDTPKDAGWTLFVELRRTLRELVDLPIFSLFLSTVGRFHLFSPEIRSDPSTRVAKADLVPLNPITEVSFDDLAFPAKEDTVTLGRVVQVDWISHLGRPLYAYL